MILIAQFPIFEDTLNTPTLNAPLPSLIDSMISKSSGHFQFSFFVLVKKLLLKISSISGEISLHFFFVFLILASSFSFSLFPEWHIPSLDWQLPFPEGGAG